MKRTIPVMLMMLLCAVWVIAQQSYPSSQAGSAQTQSSNQKQTTVTGCLSRDDGTFSLTDKAGTKYQLTGDTSQLSDHVGHEVQIKGAETQPSGTPSSTATSSSTQPQIDVSSMKHISNTCTSNTQTPPMSEKPPKQ